MDFQKDLLRKYSTTPKDVIEVWEELGMLQMPGLVGSKRLRLAELYNDTANYILDNPSKEKLLKNLDLVVIVFPLEARLFLQFPKIFDYKAEKIIDIVIKNGDKIFTEIENEHKDVDVEAETTSKLADIVYEYYEHLDDRKITIKFKKLHPDAVIPKYSHDGDVCMDMTAIGMDYDAEHDMYIYHTGLAFESDKNIGQFLFLRSSNCKTDAYLCNGVGVADSAIYRGEIQFRMKNRTSIDQVRKERRFNEFIKMLGNKNAKEPLTAIDFNMFFCEDATQEVEEMVLERAPYKVGDRVGQMVFMHYPTVELVEVEELSDTSRGEGGFGSTGK